jgi:hypothetical protein
LVRPSRPLFKMCLVVHEHSGEISSSEPLQARATDVYFNPDLENDCMGRSVCTSTERSSINSCTPRSPSSGTSRKTINSTIWKTKCLFRYESSRQLKTSSIHVSCASRFGIAKNVTASCGGSKSKIEAAHRCLICSTSSSDGG